VDLHTDPADPSLPPFYPAHVDWNIDGKGEGKKTFGPPPEVRLCPYDNFRVCVLKTRCPECGNYRPNIGEDQIIESVPLEERKAPAAAHIVTPAEKREYQDAVIALVREAREADGDEAYDRAVKELCDIARRLGYKTLWVYWQLTDSRHTVDIRAVHAIARACGYKSGWTFYIRREIQSQIGQTEATA
jgi:hypothetical protein